jgi:hypothetical protein
MTAGGPRLDERELADLQRWARRLRIMLAIGIALLAVWFAGFPLGEPAWQVPVATLAGSVLVIAGIAAQTAVRCPRCNRRLGLEQRLRLPERCANCGVWIDGGALPRR